MLPYQAITGKSGPQRASRPASHTCHTPGVRSPHRQTRKHEVNDFGCLTDAHGGDWNPAVWRHGFATRPKDVALIDALADRLRPGDGNSRQVITRSDVFACRSYPELFFLAVMAWGYGLSGYGPHRTRRIVDAVDGVDDDAIVRVIAELQRCADPEAIWRAFSAGGSARLRGLGTAFASKVAYFACYDRDAGEGPLIADWRSAWGFWAAEDVWDIRNSAALYAQYVETAVAWAHDLSVRSDDIERALFVIGPHVRKIWRQEHGPSPQGYTT